METTIKLTVAHEAVDRIARLKHLSYEQAGALIRSTMLEWFREGTAGCRLEVCKGGDIGTFVANKEDEDEDWPGEVVVE